MSWEILRLSTVPVDPWTHLCCTVVPREVRCDPFHFDTTNKSSYYCCIHWALVKHCFRLYKRGCYCITVWQQGIIWHRKNSHRERQWLTTTPILSKNIADFFLDPPSLRKDWFYLINETKRTMIIPVRCFTCGKVIGNKWETYLSLLQADFSEG